MSAYSTPGGYTSGVWLVSQNGKGAIVDKAHLPAQSTTTPYEYYWLGANEAQAMPRFPDAMNKLGIVTDQIPSDLQKAFKTGVQNLNFDSIQPFTGSHNPNTAYNKAVQGAGSAARKATTTVASIVGLLGSIDLWKGIGLIIAGVLILFIAGREVVKL